MPLVDVLWDLPDDPNGNVQHIAEHGLIPTDVEHVLNHPVKRSKSRSSGLPLIVGVTPIGGNDRGRLRGDRRAQGLSGDRLSNRGVITMAKKAYRGVSRGRHLTKSEATKYGRLRQLAARDYPPATPDAMKVAIAKLRALREARGVSLADLAARTGMTRGNIARLESQRNATLRTLERYARGLDCELEISVVSAS